MAATFAGLGFGNAGVHIPHANAYPIAGRVAVVRPPDGYPEGEPIVPHGMAVSLTAPEAFRFTYDADPDRHLRAARLLDPDVPRRRARTCSRACSRALMRGHRHPQRPGRGRVRRGRRARPGGRRGPAAAAAGHRHRGRPRRRTWPGSSAPRWNTGEVTATSPDLVQELRRRGVARRRRLDPRAGALLHRRLALPGRPAGRRPAAGDRRDPGRARRVPGPRRPGHDARRGHLDRRQRGRPGHRRRHREAPGQRAVDRPRGAHRGRPARDGARQPAARRRAARPPVRARPVDPPALHDRRDDRQQRLRLAGARLRPDRGQRRGAQGRVRHRRGRGTAERSSVARRGWRRWATTTSRTSGPSSAGSPARSAATRWSTCCRSGDGSTGSSSAPRAPSGSSWRRRSGWSPRRPGGCWSCSATRRWPRPPTPCPSCWRWAAAG